MSPKLLILGDPVNRAHTRYRGAYRRMPYYHDEFPEDHPVNQAFLWLVDEGGESGIVGDLAKASNLVSVYHSWTGEEFEIVEVVFPPEEPVVGSRLLGYDICNYWYSLLSWGLEFERSSELEVQRDPGMQIIDPLLQLLGEYFRPRLNGNGLFDDSETAAFCLECMMALQRVRPNLWENDTVVFNVVGLYEVQPRVEATS